MNEGKKNNTQQIIILAVLGLVLVFAVFKVLLPQLNASKARGEKIAARRATSTDPANKGNGVTEMPVVPTTSGSGSQKVSARAESEYRLNPNQFRVFQIDPPKNPFEQKEAWYADTLKDQLPGYPELRDNGYFENTEPLLPAVPEVLDPSRGWETVVIQRSKSGDTMEISGVSKDASIQTNVSLNTGVAERENLTWTSGLGIPLSALTQPGWEQRYPAEAAIMRAGGEVAVPKDAASAPTDGLDRSSDLFIGDSRSGLGVPGGSGDPNDALRDGQSEGDSIACTGVNRQGRRSSAIMVINGKSYIVSEGSVLPTHYQVLEIKDDGVVITDLKDGSSKWVDITAAQRGTRSGQKGKDNKPADQNSEDEGSSDDPASVIAPADLPVFVR